MANKTNVAGEVALGVPPGMPQLDLGTFDNQIFWLLITLVVIYLVLSRVALPRIAAILAERHGTITNDVAAAEELKARAESAAAVHEKALVDARAEAQRIAAETKKAIQAELETAIAKADIKIAARTAESEKIIVDIRAGSMDAVTEVAKDTAKEIVKMMGGKADARSIKLAVSAEMKGSAR